MARFGILALVATITHDPLPPKILLFHGSCFFFYQTGRRRVAPVRILRKPWLNICPARFVQSAFELAVAEQSARISRLPD